MTEPTHHRHEALGFELSVPPGWALVDESRYGLVLEVASDAETADARAAVTVEPVEPGADLAALTSGALCAHARAAGNVRLLDRGSQRLGSRGAERVVLHRDVDGWGVTVEEWRVLAGAQLITCSAACATAAYHRHAEAFGQLAGGLRLDVHRPGWDGGGVLFDPEVGLLLLTDPDFEALRAPDARPSPETADQVEGLRSAGVLLEDEPHPALAAPLGAARSPTLALTLTRGGGALRAWANATEACLLVPAGRGGWRRLVHVRADLLPDALAGFVGLGPKPAPSPREAITVGVPALARLIAGETGRPLDPSDRGTPVAEARAALGEVADHWRIEAHRPGAGHDEALEVLEAGSGLWLIGGRADQVELRPTDSSAVWRRLSRFAF